MTYKEQFWKIYDSDPEEGERLEEVAEDVGVVIDFDDPENMDECDYEEIMVEYLNQGRGYSTEDEVLEEVMEAVDEALNVDTSTFREAGLLTTNKGFVFTKNGKQYQFALLGSYQY